MSQPIDPPPPADTPAKRPRPQRLTVMAKRAFARAPAIWRSAAVLGAAGVGLMTSYLHHAHELLYVLQFIALVLVSVFCGLWPLIAFVEIGLAVAWLLVIRRGKPTVPSRVIVELNRWLGHSEAFGPYLVLAMLWHAPAALRFALVAVLLVWGRSALDWLVSRWYLRKHGTAPTALWIGKARRLPMYAATVIGTILLASLDFSQWRALAPTSVAVLMGMGLRLWATWSRPQHQHGLTGRQWSQIMDIVAVAMVLALVFLGAYSLCKPPQNVERAPRITAASCAQVPATAPLVALYLVGDTQFHELRGDRSAAFLPMVDAVVPVAVRPVALDLLSGVTLDQFAHMFELYHEQNPTTELSWASLGDLADIGCSTEMERYHNYFSQFDLPEQGKPRHRLAGIASGNHDNTFVGNFVWHPDWQPACEVPDGKGATFGYRLDKLAADALMKQLAQKFGVPGLQLPQNIVRGVAATVEGRAAQPMASPIGFLPDAKGNKRPIYAVFLDTGDSALAQYGVAGVQAHVSRAQVAAVREMVPDNALVVVLLHHPLAQMGMASVGRVSQLLRDWRSRLIVVVSAHTHVSAWHPASPIGDLEVPEFTIGSTTDPTQEAAILEIRGTAEKPTAHIATVPAVARTGMDCRSLTDVDAFSCTQVLAKNLEVCALPSDDNWRHGVHTPEAMTEHQRNIAKTLHECLGMPAQAEPMDPEMYTLAARQNPKLRERMICFSWAASILQSHKADGWRYIDGLRAVQERTATLGGLAVDVPPIPTATHCNHPYIHAFLESRHVKSARIASVVDPHPLRRHRYRHRLRRRDRSLPFGASAAQRWQPFIGLRARTRQGTRRGRFSNVSGGI